MIKITKEMTFMAYEISKKIFLKQIKKEEGLKILVELGMNKDTAGFQIQNFIHFIHGEQFTRTQNEFTTKYFLDKIYDDFGINSLKNAISALEKHIDYYENLPKGSKLPGKRKILDYYKKIVNESLTTTNFHPTEITEEEQLFTEGSIKKVLVNNYERNSSARKKCIEYHGFNCAVCDMNFEKFYGKEIGKDFIHVHHKIDLSLIKKTYTVNPITDLIPVCPNCHAMLHKKTPAYTIEELKYLIQKN
ncbi:HNH endonuclease [Aureivirga marina]|uniref:HNH endonuclease n=1 Tax=Aureivirga marina TaxID=1182451 RepID=UPI0018CAD85A|nr:HNH endonuclease [Aureivirga marina]